MARLLLCCIVCEQYTSSEIRLLQDKREREKITNLKRAGCDSLVSLRAVHSLPVSAALESTTRKLTYI